MLRPLARILQRLTSSSLLAPHARRLVSHPSNHITADSPQWIADLYAKHRVVVQASDATASGLANTNQMMANGKVGFTYPP